MEMVRPIIYKYHDYRVFLKDMFSFLKNKKARFMNMKFVSKKLGVTPSYLSMILNKKRELNPSLVNPLSEIFEMDEKEKSFFKLLLNFNLSKHDLEKASAIDMMKQVKQYQDHNPVEVAYHEYMSNWLNVTIREMTAIDGFSDDPKWIQEKLRYPVKMSEIRESINFLIEKGIVAKDENGKFEKPNKSIDCVDHVYKNALIQFHRSFLKLAGDSTLVSETHERELMGHCICLAEENYDEAKLILGEAFERIRNLQKKQNGKQVYCIELALFPLTKGE
jgi:uncharacterized protein (TIGR02147 family)